MRGRNTVDPELARVVEQRLERLLAERGPRRAVARSGVLPDDPAEVGISGVEGDDAGTSAPLRSGRRDRSLSSTTGQPAESRSRLGFHRAHLGIIGVLVVIGVLLGGWAVLRAKPVALPVAGVVPRVDPANPSAAGSASAPASESGSTPRGSGASRTRASPAAVVVHVLGAVRRPGLVELPAGARVQDAIEAAGGLKAGARLGSLNLAQALGDGQQLIVGQSPSRSEVRGGTASPGGSGSSGSAGDSLGSGSSAQPLDLNAASAAQLETLPGVGPVTAAKIISWREEHGRFARVEELQEVAGIGPKTYAEIAPHVRV